MISAKRLVNEFDRKFDRFDGQYKKTLRLEHKLAILNEALMTYFNNRVRIAETNAQVRENLEKAIKIILNGSEEGLQDFVKKFKEEFFSASIQDIAFPRGVSDIDKWVAANGTMMKGIPIHVRGSVVYNRLLKMIHSGEYAPIKNGDKIKFVYLKTPNLAQSHVIAFLDTLPTAFDLDKSVDREMQFNKTFLEPLKSLAIIANMSVEKMSTLDSFFE